MLFLLNLSGIGGILKTAKTECISASVDLMFLVPPSEISSIVFTLKDGFLVCTPILAS